MAAFFRLLRRVLLLLILALLCLQLYFALRIGVMRFVLPSSTAFQRAQLITLAEQGQWNWNQETVAGSAINDSLRRAVIASEDANFASHGGVEWDAIRQAQARNDRAEAKVEAKLKRKPDAVLKPAKVVGGSTISQQLAKNLFLSGERHLLRKGQELVLTYMLEWILGKDRILDIYLNSVEWGSGIFGAQAAAQFYFHTDAAKLSAAQSARLAVMLPAPRKFEQAPASNYLRRRSRSIQGRMGGADLPE
jgi:monofunctional biosynthetic peptidoglycan transglycosylase